jgi:hypothetical protein
MKTQNIKCSADSLLHVDKKRELKAWLQWQINVVQLKLEWSW